MLVEIGFGLTTLALVHLVAHVLLRSHQLLRAPSAMRDARALEAAGIAEDHNPPLVAWLPRPMATWIYHQSLERFGLEALFDRALVTPLFELGLALDRAERRFVSILGGHPPAPPPVAKELAPEPAPASTPSSTNVGQR
jgi:hypothetical protein